MDMIEIKIIRTCLVFGETREVGTVMKVDPRTGTDLIGINRAVATSGEPASADPDAPSGDSANPATPGKSGAGSKKKAK